MRSTTRVAEASAVRVGCAGWSLPRAQWPRFPAEGSHLERYAARFDAAEIDTSFYRPHRAQTYARWAASTPPHFRFAVKLPKTVTHEARLDGARDALDAFLGEVAGLGPKLGCLLIQLAPSHAFDANVVRRFLADLQRRHEGPVAIEPRHASWFAPEVDALLARQRVARVLADPVLHAGGEWPGGWPQLVYLRLHGRPRVYWSAYDDALLERLALRLQQARSDGAACWCIFDNTAGGEATGNALTLKARLSHRFNEETT
ncbi:DUF72 domain-containing protein [Xenophilus aerolatus]|nr:DUF72 domain-containing protein [Xenophilus aerolatus]